MLDTSYGFALVATASGNLSRTCVTQIFCYASIVWREVGMTLSTRLNVLVALMSFGFIAAIAVGAF